MKTSKRYKIKTSKIHSLEDITAEKTRLKFEIRLKEEHIQSNYRHILDAFTLRNLTSTLVTELSATSSIVSKALSMGKSILERRKKKKKEKLSGDIPDSSLPGH
ncbi:MAG: hypothetical protein M0Q38_16570 [Bacteroidales bacterium]|jgi:hypothetical protein|nr:hypothetical protein [Bacteroidales bacterium]